MKKPVRTIEYAIDLTLLRRITAEHLSMLNEEEYDKLRRQITAAHRIDKDDRYICPKCECGIYVPDTGPKNYYWQHFKGAPRDCEWLSTESKSVDEVSAKQYHGVQESKLHKTTKYLIADLLTIDTSFEKIEVEKRAVTPEGNRQPDIRANFSEKKITLELQLSTTQIPTILKREHFDRNQGDELHWITLNFEEKRFSEIRRTFKDIYSSHNKNIISIDEITVRESQVRKIFHIRVHAWRNGKWKNAVIPFAKLKRHNNRLPYYFPLEEDWYAKFQKDWEHASRPDKKNWAKLELLHKTLIDRLITETQVISVAAHLNENLLDLIYSFEFGAPIASRETNLVSVANSFLNSPKHHKYANFVEKIIRRSGREDVLIRESVLEKLRIARQQQQVSSGGSFDIILGRLVSAWGI